MMQRIPTALELTAEQILCLRDILARSFVPAHQVALKTRLRLIELGLVQNALGGLMSTPAGRIVGRM